MSVALRSSGQKWLSRLFRNSSHERTPNAAIETLSNCRNVADDHLQQDAIRLSRHIQAFLEGTSDCVLFLDPQWRFTFFNRRAAEELRTGPEFIGVKIWEAFPEVLGTAIERYYRRAMTERTLEIFEDYFEPLAAWFEIHAVPVADGGLTVIFRNITLRRLAAEALRTRERQLATVFSQTVVGIMHRDLNQNVLMINERYCEIVGRSREELIGLPMKAFTHPDDVERSIAVFQKHLRTGEPFQIEKRYLRPDGSEIWCDVNVSFVRDDTGRVTSTITVAEDIHSRKLAEEEARESQRLLQVVIDSIQDLVFVKDREGRFVFANRQLTEGHGPLQGMRAQDCVLQDLSDLYEKSDRQVLTSGEPFTVEEVIPIRGEPRRFQTVKVPWKRDGEIIGVIGVSRDLTERLEAEAELIENRRQLTTLIDNLPGLVYRCSTSAPWAFSFMSEGAEALTGYRTRDFVEQRITWGDITHPDDLAFVEEATLESVTQHKTYSIVYRIINHSGEVRWVHDRGQGVYGSSGEADFLEGIISDVTAQKEAEERTIWLAHHDSLTQLPNRLLFQMRLEEAVRQSEMTGGKVGLLLLDIDHLKDVNDTLGHSAGDVVLQTIAERLRASVRGIDTVARNGGDEFAIVLPDIAGREEIDAVAAPILEKLQKPLVYAGRLLDCRASIGASIWPDHAMEGESLLKQADAALYAAKATGRGKMMAFEPSMRTETQKRMQMRDKAREAIDTRRIEAFYQPKVHLDSGRLAGFEALLRWRNPQAEVELPSAIQAAFEDPQLAVAIGQQMHEMIFENMRRWLDAGVEFGHVAINASAAEFRGTDFAEGILERLHKVGIPARHLELEVTETVFLGRGAEHVEKALRTLNAAGVRIALDDFGTGYASLSHLKQFPVDSIKIDQSFVRDLAENRSDTAILRAILSLGKDLGITTVAEGVETQIQAEFLRSQRCDLGQGYLFGKAASKEEIPRLVASWRACTC